MLTTNYEEDEQQQHTINVWTSRQESQEDTPTIYGKLIVVLDWLMR